MRMCPRMFYLHCILYIVCKIKKAFQKSFSNIITLMEMSGTVALWAHGDLSHGSLLALVMSDCGGFL